MVIATPYFLVTSTPFDKLLPHSEVARSVSLRPPLATDSGFRSRSRRAVNPQPTAVQHVRVYHRGLDVLVPQEFLDRSNVAAVLQ